MRKQEEDQAAKEPVSRRAGAMSFYLWSSCLDQTVILHTRGAGCDTSHAAETCVDVTDKLVAKLSVVFETLSHQMNPSPWGVHFIVPEYVRRAYRQAEAAVHTVGYEIT